MIVVSSVTCRSGSTLVLVSVVVVVFVSLSGGGLFVSVFVSRVTVFSVDIGLFAIG
jgi:hypothetical protein